MKVRPLGPIWIPSSPSRRGREISQRRSLIEDFPRHVTKAAFLSGYTFPVQKSSRQTAKASGKSTPPFTPFPARELHHRLSLLAFLPAPCPRAVGVLNVWPSFCLQQNHMASYTCSRSVSRDKRKHLLHSRECPKNRKRRG